MQNKIHLLPKDLINKIAAGEVVERPASILKELVENSIDAGADDIQITLEKSGLDKIIISDNGIGLNSQEVQTAFLQHATSKINSSEDLANIATMGFRGEALPSISSISSVNVHSYNGIDKPVLFKIEEGKENLSIGQGRSRGTTITVSNIFANIPVRRKFLKSENTEYRYFLEYFLNIAIANPNINFTLTKNQKKVYALKRTNSILDRILQVFPNIKKQDFLEIDYNNTNIKITGFIGKPNTAKNINSHQYIFLNKRFIKSALIHKAIKEGYSTAIMKNLEPMYFIFLEMNPQDVDVNVHPRKLEVRFINTGLIYNSIKAIIINTIEKESKVAFQNLVKNYQQDSSKFQPTVNKQLDQNDVFSSPSYIKKSQKNVTKSASINITKEILQTSQQINNLIPENTTSTLPSQALQVFNTYLVFEQDNKLIIIDQHAAHERINFEKILEQFEEEKNLSSQTLLIPISINIDNLIKEKIFSNQHFLRQCGFDFTINKNTLNLNSIPNIIKTDDISQIFKQIINELETTDGEGSPNWTNIRNKILATIACHASIRAGQKLEQYVIKQIVNDLLNCKLPYSCPHGRPFFWEISRLEMEKSFKR